MSTSASNESNSTTSGPSNKRKHSEEANNIQRKKLASAVSRQSVDRVTKNVQDAHSREAEDGSDPVISIVSTLPSQISPVMNRNGGTQAGEGVNPDFTTPTEAPTVVTETPSINLLQGSSNFQISNTKIVAVGGNAIIIQCGDGQFTEVQRKLIWDDIAALSVSPDIRDNLKKPHVLGHSIELLPRAKAAFVDHQTKKSEPCLEGTRVALLREITNWFTGKDESRMCILSGLAGMGKSTLAYTIALREANRNRLSASFFFSRNEADCNNAKKLFTTIAYQLCVYSETFATAIGNVLLTNHGSTITSKTPQEQLKILILDPLKSVIQPCTLPVLVVVDALDECAEDDVSSVVEGLGQLVRELPSFKVILTTCPQLYFDCFFNQSGHEVFHLQDIEDEVIDGDIRLYLKHNLSLEKVQERYPEKQWYASDEQIDALVRAAGRLFIIASIAVRYLLDKSASNPAAQMQTLLHACAQDHTPLKDLDHFYTVILRNIVPANCDDDDIVSRYQSVVGAIIFIQRPLPVSALAPLIDIDAKEIHVVIDNLRSLQLVIGNDDVPWIHGKSFPNYLMDQTRCKDPCLRIDPKIRHTQIAIRCFETMNKHLKYNILDLGNVARYMSNEDGLKKEGITDEQLQEKIPEQLRYACVSWANHFEVANIEVSELMNRLTKFMDEHVLHWFEVLSLIGDLDSAHRALRVVLKLLKSTSSDLHQLLSDALQFISKFYEVIKRSALHTYYSVLPFSPTNSLLYRRYIKEAKHNICDIEGAPEKWDALIANLNHGERVGDIRFSFDSVRFVSCSKEDIAGTTRNPRKLMIWDTATRTPISTIPGHKFAVTNDFSTVASFSDNIITYYNMDGSPRGIVFKTPSKIQKLAFSESGRVAAALSDGTVWLWESGSAKFIGSFNGFASTGWPRFQFSPTGTRLAYSSEVGFIKLRNGISGKLIGDLRCKPWRDFVFSGDGSRIVSVAYDRGLALWNTENGGPVGVVKDVALDVDVVAISANGDLVATADRDNVTLWVENRGHLARIDVLESTHTKSMAFSPDNILAIGTFPGIKLYNTKAYSFISTLSFSGLSAPLAFSPDSTHLAGGNDYGNVYLWDMRGIDASSSLSQEATVFTAIALSRDCSRLACGFMDGTVELWGISPTKRLIASSLEHRPHRVSTVEFASDNTLFASGSDDGTIKLWNAKDGSLHGTLNTSRGLQAVALSGSVLVAAGNGGVTLWSLKTRSFIHILKESSIIALAVSISDDSGTAALGFDDESVHLVDVMNRTTIAVFTVSDVIHKLTFLPDKSRLVAQTCTGDFLSLNPITYLTTNGTTLKNLMQLPDTPLWHDVPIWHCSANGQHYLAGLFSQHPSPVPVLWIPSDIAVDKWTQGSSMIALGCQHRRIILLRLATS